MKNIRSAFFNIPGSPINNADDDEDEIKVQPKSAYEISLSKLYLAQNYDARRMDMFLGFHNCY